MKYLWVISVEGPFRDHRFKVITDNHNPIEAINVATNSDFIKDVDGNPRNIVSVEFLEPVYA